MRHPERHQMNPSANTAELHLAKLAGQLHSEQLIETEGDGDLYVAELTRRIADHASEDEQSMAAFDWIN